MKPKALLILAHQGRSYIERLSSYLKKQNVLCLTISSKPRSQLDLELLQKNSEKTWVLETDYITEEGLDAVLKGALNDYDVINVLATFEAYRKLMAKVNQRLSGLDSSPAALSLCMDKYACRQLLEKKNLTQVKSHLLSKDILENLQKYTQQYFVKPRRGAGSFACFKLKADLSISDIENLQEQMQSDLQFSAIFNGEFGFMAESYIEGDEYSFETLVLDGESYVIGVHAKYLEESMGTTLEVSNSLPATELFDQEQLAGEIFIADCLKALGLNEGAYHIEARYNKNNQRWEIIEINTRMGGALINQSVEIFTGGESFLKLWTETLCMTENGAREQLKLKFAGLRESTRRANDQIKDACVFISRYGKPGKILSHLSIENVQHKPDIIDLPVKVGTRLPESDRGIFICNALWRVDVSHLKQSLLTLPEMFDNGLEVNFIN
jgi:D-alanine-D-alanine ligase-like ATP-grasp enzyme